MYNAFGTKVAEHTKLYTKVHKPENIYVNQPVNDKLLIIINTIIVIVLYLTTIITSYQK